MRPSEYMNVEQVIHNNGEARYGIRNLLNNEWIIEPRLTPSRNGRMISYDNALIIIGKHSAIYDWNSKVIANITASINKDFYQISVESTYGLIAVGQHPSRGSKLRYGYINSQGQVVGSLDYDWVSLIISMDRLRVCSGGKKGYLDPFGYPIIPLEWDDAYDFDPNTQRAVVYKGRKKHIIDINGKIVK
jgi:hypothetical protein